MASIALNLETAATAVSQGLVAQASQLNTEGLAFSTSGWSDLTDFHDRVLGNTQLALSVLMTGVPDAVRQLLREKDKVRKVEAKLQERHLARLRDSISASFETSRMHQDVLRTPKNINAAFATIGHPIAARSGDLQRLLAAYGANKMIWAPGIKNQDITDYHIDSLARFSGPNRMIIQLMKDPDPSDPWQTTPYETHDIIAANRAAIGRAIDITVIPEPQNPRIKNTPPCFFWPKISKIPTSPLDPNPTLVSLPLNTKDPDHGRCTADN